MAPLTWRNVQAADLGGAAFTMNNSIQNLRQGFENAANIGHGIFDDRVRIGSREALEAASQFTTSADWSNALANGTAMGGVAPRYIDAQVTQSLLGRRNRLLNEEAAAQTMALRASAAASGGGSGGGGRGTRTGTSSANPFAITQAQGALREAIGAYGEGSPEAIAAANRLQELGTLLENSSAYLDGSDALAAAARLSRENVDAAAVDEAAQRAATLEAGGAAADSLRFPNQSTNTETISGLDYSGATINNSLIQPVARPDTQPDTRPITDTPVMGISTRPVARPDLNPQPEFPLPLGAYAAPQNTPINSGLSYIDPRESLSFGSEYPPIGNNLTNTTFSNFDPNLGEFVNNLSFGSDIPSLPFRTNPNIPSSWSDYASRVSDQYSHINNPLFDNQDVDSILKLPSYIQNTPQFQLFQDDLAIWDSRNETIDDRNEIRITEVNPQSIQTVKDTIVSNNSSFTAAEASNPDFRFIDFLNSLRETDNPSSITTIAEAVVSEFPGLEADNDLISYIDKVSREYNVDPATVGAAIVDSRNTDNAYRWNTYRQNGTRYFNTADVEDRIRNLGEDVNYERMVESHNAYRNIRSEESSLKHTFNTATEALNSAVIEHGSDSPQAIQARNNLLEASNAYMNFSTTLRDRLNRDFFNLRPQNGNQLGERPRIEDYITPEVIRNYEGVQEKEQEEINQNMELFGRPDAPTEPDWEYNVFTPQSTVDSIMGQASLEILLAPENISTFFNEENENLDTFVNWVGDHRETRERAFNLIREAQYTGENVHIPKKWETDYNNYINNPENIPESIFNTFLELGFDFNNDMDTANELANNPEMQEIIRDINRYDSFWSSRELRNQSRDRARRFIRMFGRDTRNMRED